MGRQWNMWLIDDTVGEDLTGLADKQVRRVIRSHNHVVVSFFWFCRE